jgi:hypothetical protein
MRPYIKPQQADLLLNVFRHFFFAKHLMMVMTFSAVEATAH